MLYECCFDRSPFPVEPRPTNAVDVGIKGAAWKKLVIFKPAEKAFTFLDMKREPKVRMM